MPYMNLVCDSGSITVISSEGNSERWAAAYGSVLLPTERLSVLPPNRLEIFPTGVDLLHIDFLDRNLEGQIGEIDPHSIVIMTPLMNSPRDAFKASAPGVRTSARHPDTPDETTDSAGILTLSMIPIWHSPWFTYVRRALSASRIGSITRFDASVSTPRHENVPVFKRTDADSVVMRALSIPCGLALRPVEWDGVSAVQDGSVKATGHVGSVPVTITMLECDRPMTLVVTGTTGSIEIQAEDTKALATVRDALGQESTRFEHFDVFAYAARAAVETMRRGRPLMPRIEGSLAVRQTAFQLEDALQRFSSSDKSADTRPDFESNTFVTYRKENSGWFEEAKVFIESRCNLSCPFCFSRNPDEAARSLDEYAAVFADLIKRGFSAVILSGGEPTLNPHLTEIVKTALTSGMKSVAIETNAIMLDKPETVKSLIEAGLGAALISLHSLDPDTLFMMTGARGTLDRTLAGFDNLQKSGIPINVNCVTSIYNYRELPRIAAFVAARPTPVRQVGLSFIAGVGDAVDHPEIIAKITDVAPFMKEALEILNKAGIDVIIPGQCGIPQCMLPDNQESFINNRLAKNYPGWKACRIHNKVYKDSCRQCAVFDECYGIWQNYASVYGTDEFVPLKKI